MEDFKKRLVIERNELKEKLDKLNAFNESEKSKQLPQMQQELLLIQAGAIHTYLMVLETRINTII